MRTPNIVAAIALAGSTGFLGGCDEDPVTPGPIGPLGESTPGIEVLAQNDTPSEFDVSFEADGERVYLMRVRPENPEYVPMDDGTIHTGTPLRFVATGVGDDQILYSDEVVIQEGDRVYLSVEDGRLETWIGYGSDFHEF